jgi:outer membrane protein OmpA-like peptidoglycan-associated protein
MKRKNILYRCLLLIFYISIIKMVDDTAIAEQWLTDKNGNKYLGQSISDDSFRTCNGNVIDTEGGVIEETDRSCENLIRTDLPRPAPAVRDKFNLTINFESGKTEIRKEDKEQLRKAEEFIKKYPNNRIMIEGHTDSIGSEKYNMRLSQRRAETIKKYFVQTGNVDPGKISALGYGELKPVDSNKTKTGMAKNRRVEFLIVVE